MYLCIYVCVYVFMYAGMYACMYICMYLCIYVCMHECVYVYTVCIILIPPPLGENFPLNKGGGGISARQGGTGNFFQKVL